jgi:hypothetical protein
MRRASIALIALMLAASANAGDTGLAQASLMVRFGATSVDGVLGGGEVRGVTKFTVPSDHVIHDGLFPSEGIGWESDRVAYRLYFDERNAVDIFGKRLPAPVMQTAGIGPHSYHDMADWGMDIFRVGTSLGLGSLGVLRDSKAQQIGKSTITVSIEDSGPHRAAFTVTSAGFGPEKATLTARYAIAAGTTVTHVHARVDGQSPTMVTGLIKNPNVEVLRPPKVRDARWGYVATWGKQSLAGDLLGLAVFYRLDTVRVADGDDGVSYFVVFKEAHVIDYAFAARWQQEANGSGAITTLPDFAKWLETQRRMLEAEDAH